MTTDEVNKYLAGIDPHQVYGCVDASTAAARWPEGWRVACADAEWVARNLGVQLLPIGARLDEDSTDPHALTVLCRLMRPTQGLSTYMFLNVPVRLS